VTLVLCWIVFPLVLAVLALGCGLLLETVSGTRLPSPLLLPAGLAVVVLAAQFAVLSGTTAELAVPAVVALAVAGIALRPLAWIGRLDGWALAGAGGVFCVFAAPVVLSGHVTFAGYIRLDDTATWLAITDRVMEHGRDVGNLDPSTYEATLKSYLSNDYPVGSFLPLGIGHVLTGQDSAWLFQPYLAFLGAMLALALYTLSAPLIESRRVGALAAFLASQPAILFGYSLWGGVKEMAGAWILATVGALLVLVIRRDTNVGVLVPAALACGATLSILSFGGVIWLLPALLAALIVVAVSAGVVTALWRAVGFATVMAAFCIPALLEADKFLSPGGRETLTSASELGNLLKPLDGLQVLGIWPVGDFRFRPDAIDVTHLLLLVLALAAAGGLVFCWRRRAWGALFFFATAAVGCFVVTSAGSPWVDGKALATASPAFVLMGLLGASAPLAMGRRLPAVLIVLAIGGGVVWSNALAYHEVNLAPHDRFEELRQIGHEIAGEGPTLMTDYEPYGARHFLREADAEGASELRRRVVPLRSGRVLDKLEVADIDEFQLQGILVYRTLVLRRSPVASRPPSEYRLVRNGRYYEVWQRPETATSSIVQHLSVGSGLAPLAVPRCRSVMRLARVAGPGGRLAAVERPAPTVIGLSGMGVPATWHANDPATVTPSDAGAVELLVRLPASGRYSLWVGGAFRRDVQILIDERRVAQERNILSHAGEYVPMGTVQLSSGAHTVVLRYGDSDLHPGSGGEAFPLGPIALARSTAAAPVIYVPSKRARSLCGRQLDWVEALRG
jgi:hypothetical protein